MLSSSILLKPLSSRSAGFVIRSVSEWLMICRGNTNKRIKIDKINFMCNF